MATLNYANSLASANLHFMPIVT